MSAGFLTPDAARGTASPAAGRRALALADAALAAAGLVVFLSYAVVAVAHRNDRYQVNFVSGVYAALAAHLNEGTFYPELYDGEHFGGTRYMPLPFVLHAGVARLTGEYLLSGKLLAYALTAVLCLQLFVILRRLGCGPGAALALASLVLANEPGFLAATTIRGDLLPVVLQLGAVMVACANPSLRRAALAGVLCALAVLSKQSAGWAFLALLCYYLPRRRRHAAVFVAAWLGALVPALAACQVLSGGRMLDNLTAFSGSGVGGPQSLLAPLLLLWRVGRGGVLLAFLVPALALECVAAVRGRRLGVHHHCLFACLLVLLVIYSDSETNMNHLLDLVVVAIPVAGCLWAALPAAGAAAGGLRLGLGLAVAWVAYTAWANTMVFETLTAARLLREGRASVGHPAKPLAGLVGDDEKFLSEDPWVAIARRQKPRVLDPYSLGRFTESRPELAAELVRRVEAREFTRIILCRRLGEASPHDRRAWEDRHFGRPVVRSIRAHYRLRAQAEGFYVYEPRRAGGVSPLFMAGEKGADAPRPPGQDRDDHERARNASGS
jgi:hypothetical protein